MCFATTIRFRIWQSVGLLLLSGVLWGTHVSAQDQTAAGASAAPISIWNKNGLEDFEFTDRTGETVTKQQLLGKEWAIGFMFSRCRGPCPILVGAMKQLQEETGVNMVVFTVDPEVDTPDVLKRFSEQYVPAIKPNSNGETPKWYWLTGEKKKILGYIRRNFLVPAVNENGSPDHSNLVMHVDETGRVLGKYLGTESAEMALLRRIIQKKAPRGKMMSDPIPKNAIQVEGAPPGFTFVRTQEPGNAAESSAEVAEGKPFDDPAGLDAAQNVPEWVRNLPAVNASLNGLATILLVIGYVLIKLNRVQAHKTVMLSCFATSVVFLCSYCIYHAFVLSKRFPGTGSIKSVYYVILITHIILAATVPVLASMTIYRALTQQWARHKSIARITFPIWLYVSVTGVIIYLMLYQMPVG